MLKSLLLGLVFMPPLIAAFTWILQRAGPWVPVQLWAFFLAVSLFFMTIYPVVIGEFVWQLLWARVLQKSTNAHV